MCLPSKLNLEAFEYVSYHEFTILIKNCKNLQVDVIFIELKP